MVAERLNHIKEAFLWVSFYPLLVTFYPIKVHLVSVLSTKVAVLGKKMRYLFSAGLLYSNTVDMRQAYRQYCLAGLKISMTQEERENLISGFLSANAGNTDENTTRMLNMLVESLAYSKLQELLPEVQKQSSPAQPKEKSFNP